jgi:ribosome-binding protein aMBF1 (putative translation factor)
MEGIMATTGRWGEIRERVLDTPESKERYERKKRALVQTREILMQIDAARERLGLSKAELARRIGSDPSVVRRLFSSKTSNPTLRVILDLVAVLDLDLELRPAQTDSPLPPSPDKPRASTRKDVAA